MGRTNIVFIADICCVMPKKKAAFYNAKSLCEMLVLQTLIVFYWLIKIRANRLPHPTVSINVFVSIIFYSVTDLWQWCHQLLKTIICVKDTYLNTTCICLRMIMSIINGCNNININNDFLTKKETKSCVLTLSSTIPNNQCRCIRSRLHLFLIHITYFVALK